MVYVALLRGINVGGKARVEMARLKIVLETLGFTQVVTYINSGNVVFHSAEANNLDLATKIEKGIAKEFQFHVPVVIRSKAQIDVIDHAVPAEWLSNNDMRTDVLFLWAGYDSPAVLNDLKIRPELEDVLYVPGAIIWRVDRHNLTKSGMTKIAGTELYKNMTIRNVNTLRKIVILMEKKG